jgi:hypothetical protein
VAPFSSPAARRAFLVIWWEPHFTGLIPDWFSLVTAAKQLGYRCDSRTQHGDIIAFSQGRYHGRTSGYEAEGSWNWRGVSRRSIDRLRGFRTARSCWLRNPQIALRKDLAGASAAAVRKSNLPIQADISAMMAALPDKPYATPQSLRHVLVLCRAVGWVHTSIPLGIRSVSRCRL